LIMILEAFFFLFCLFFFGAGIEPRASLMLGKPYATELHPSPWKLFSERTCVYFLNIKQITATQYHLVD
jgi:hypothetical protein